MYVVLSALALAASSIQVDEGVTEVRTCRISALAFRADTDGWMFDHCGGIFRSSDGALSWIESPEMEKEFFGVTKANRPFSTSAHVQSALWISQSTGLLFIYPKPEALRTEDGGRTWTRVKFPWSEAETIYALEHVGERIWFCDSSGRVRGSLDAGKTWSTGQKLFDEAGVNPVDWCSALSFLDENDGWAAGWRSLWRTADGGATWSEMARINPESAASSTRRRKEEVRGLVRLNKRLAWARTDTGGLFRTKDGGIHWEFVPSPKLEPDVISRRDGRSIISVTRVGPNTKLEDVTPVADDYWTPIGTRAVTNHSMDKYVDGKLVRRGPPTSPPLGKLVTLLGVTTTGATTYGWTTSSIFRADDGHTWRRVGTAPAAVKKLEAANERDLFAIMGEALHRSTDGGETWTKSEDVVSRADWAKLTRTEAGLRSTDSVRCALRGPARVSITFGVNGCFGGSTSKFSLEIGPHGTGHGEGSWREWNPTINDFDDMETDQLLTPAEVKAAIQKLAEAIERMETPTGCWSTSRTFATVSWQCDGPSSRVKFETNECGPKRIPSERGETRSLGSGGEGYARAIGVFHVADTLLKRK
jgi:photosystem II stability/assembly factor-like uncharacterized protein